MKLPHALQPVKSRASPLRPHDTAKESSAASVRYCSMHVGTVSEGVAGGPGLGAAPGG